ncbi:MAG: S1 family peptidase [Acidimicrobiales bacterium]
MSDWIRYIGLSNDTDEPILRQLFWPPNILGAVIIALVLSVTFGFLGALVYTRSETGQIKVADPGTDPVPEAPAVPAGAEATTTTKPVSLSPEALARKVAPSVWSVSTLDDAGRPVQGSAFVAGAFGGQSYLLTSLSVVRASTRVPGPGIVVRSGGNQQEATLWTWQEERDLALLVVSRAAPTLRWSDEIPNGRDANKVYGAAGTGGVTAGAVSGVSAGAIQHNIFTDDGRQGGPLLNDKGEVLGVLSRDYDPGGSATDRVFYAVPVRIACEKVLKCGAGNATAPATTTTRPSNP